MIIFSLTYGIVAMILFAVIVFLSDKINTLMYLGIALLIIFCLIAFFESLSIEYKETDETLENNTKKCAEYIQSMKEVVHKNKSKEVLQITTITKSKIYSARIKLKDNSYIDSKTINLKKILKNRYLYFIYFDIKDIDFDKENIELDINFEKENFLDFLLQVKDKTKKDIIINQEELNQIKEYANILSKYDISKTNEGYKVKEKQKYKIISEFEYKEHLKKIEELKEIIENQGETK